MKMLLQGRRYRARKGLGATLFRLSRGIHKEDYTKAFESWISRLKLCLFNKKEVL